MNWISSEYLALIGGIALCVYLYCSYQERRKGPAPAVNGLEGGGAVRPAVRSLRRH